MILSDKKKDPEGTKAGPSGKEVWNMTYRMLLIKSHEM